MKKFTSLPFLLSILLGLFLTKNTMSESVFKSRDEIPSQYRWRLDHLFESKVKWREFHSDMKKKIDDFSEKIDKWQKTPVYLADRLEELESLFRDSSRLTAYASLNAQVAWSEADFQDMSSRADVLDGTLSSLEERIRKHIGLLSMEEISKFVESDERIRARTFYLTEAKRMAGNQLPDNWAQLDSLLQSPRQTAETLRRMEIPKGEIRLPDGQRLDSTGEILQKFSVSENAAERKALALSQSNRLKGFENTFASLLNAAVRADVYKAGVQGYRDSLSAELSPYGVDSKVYLNLISIVGGHPEALHRFLALRKRLLHLHELHPYDDTLPLFVSEPVKYTYPEAWDIFMKALSFLGPEYREAQKQAVSENWVDAFGHPNKMNFGSAQFFQGLPPYVSLDFRNSFFDMITVAHEMGHALSFHFPRQSNPLLLSLINWFVSEVPSTFNEIAVMNHLSDTSKDPLLKRYYLMKSIDRLNLLLFTCSMNAEFQLACHRHVEDGGTLSPSWLNEKYLGLYRHYHGHERSIMVVDDFMMHRWNHPNLFFAPYQSYYYVVGSVVSLAFLDAIEREGEPAVRRYMNFLKAGGSRPVMDILREAGIDLETPEPVLNALNRLDQMVIRLEELCRNQNGSMGSANTVNCFGG